MSELNSPANLDLMSAVIELTKDPAKYSEYLKEMRNARDQVAEDMKKYNAFKSAEEWIANERQRLAELTEILNTERKSLEKTKIEYTSWKRSEEEKIENHKATIKGLESTYDQRMNALDHRERAHKEIERRRDDAEEMHWRRERTLQEREALFMQKIAALKALIKE
jgi:hypothetical protein